MRQDSDCRSDCRVAGETALHRDRRRSRHFGVGSRDEFGLCAGAVPNVYVCCTVVLRRPSRVPQITHLILLPLFSIQMAGDALVLIDEADVFLEARNSTEIARNALGENDFHIEMEPTSQYFIKC